jgi:hypothetical protein
MILIDPWSLFVAVLAIGSVVGVALFLLTRAAARVGAKITNSAYIRKVNEKLTNTSR